MAIYRRMALINDNWDKLTEEKAEIYMEHANTAYRSGIPIMSDAEYDRLLDYYSFKFPDNAIFKQEKIESDLGIFEGKTVKLPQRMLSTNKFYDVKALAKWVDSIVNEDAKLDNPSKLQIKVTPKLDGFAAYDGTAVFLTRGDGRKGTDISHVFERGLLTDLDQETFVRDRGFGKGEIVVNKQYFERYLSNQYENSRNIIASIIKKGELSHDIQTAIDLAKVVFKPFSHLNCVMVDYEELYKQETIDNLWDILTSQCAYDTDGLVLETIDSRIRHTLGDTNHHHRWQAAYKRNLESFNIKVTGIINQTSKNGLIIPVVSLVPTKVSGVTITKATGHNYGNIIKSKIGIGAVVKVCRSGLVIPYIQEVIKPSINVIIPDVCPSCNSPTELMGDDLICTNTESCPAQIEKRIAYFFETINNCDGFGPKVIEQICATDINSIQQFYTDLSFDRLVKLGFGEKTSSNLMKALETSKKVAIDDWRFLAAFGVKSIGKGGCEKLLKKYKLADVFNLTVGDIISIEGFATKSANLFIESLVRIKPAFDALYSLGFNIVATPINQVIESPIAGKTIVFTGSMVQGNRSDMERQAKALGAKVSSSVSKNTDYLVCGENVGKTKTDDAIKLNVKVILEADYLDLIK